MKQYALIPTDGRKSFYNKALVTVDDSGTETLYSYNTPIIKKTASGELVKLWDGWTATTGRHIKAFCGLSKAEFDRLQMPDDNRKTGGYLTPLESYQIMIARRAVK